MTDSDAVRLSVSILDQLANHVDEAIEEFAGWDVPARESRLGKTSALLRATAKAGRFPTEDAELSVVSEAIRHGQEFVEIANVLPKVPIPSLRTDVRAALGGNLDPVSSSTGPHLQFQTQLWVGSMLAQTQMKVGVLTRPGGAKNPDYIIENGTYQYAVEVKRPNGTLDAYNIVRKAARQIRSEAYHGGMIVVDLTDCIDPELRYTRRPGPPDPSTVYAVLENQLEELHNQVYNSGSELLKNRREHVFGLYGFCRYAHWDSDDLRYPYLMKLTAVSLYWRRNPGTLRGHRAKWLTDLIGLGIVAAGHEQTSTRPLGFNA